MTNWRSFGASVIGPGHVATGKPNQDSWASFHCALGDGIVVSDGLGSKPYSEFGSRAACHAVVNVLHGFSGNAHIDRATLSDKIKDEWVYLLAPLDSIDCAATCLFSVRMNSGLIIMGMLGDGLISAVKSDGSVMSLTNKESDGFSNITVALSSDVNNEAWRWHSLQDRECLSILLCTDGVADDLSDAEGFVKEFCGAHRELSSLSAARCTREMLEKWPTPKHSDDKTIACMIRDEVVYE